MQAPRDFLSRYLDYTRENEAPEIFHFWSVIALLGHVLNRRVWFPQYTAPTLYPGQIMVCLVSPSAVSRKTTAINIAIELVSQLPEDAIRIIEGPHSVKMLYEALSRGNDEDGHPLDCPGIIIADELGVFLSKESFQDAMTGTLTQLNTARDGPVVRRMAAGSAYLHNVTLGLLAGTTPTGIAHEIPKAAQKAGFFGRVLWVHATQSDRCNPLTEAPANMTPLRDALIADLYRMVALRGPFTWTPEGKALFERWYREYFEKGQTMQSDSMTSGFYGRKAQHVLRVAMVMQVCRSNRLQLGPEVFTAALAAVEQIERQLVEIHSEIGTSRYAEQQERVLTALGHMPKGRLGHRTLYERLWKYIPPNDLTVVLKGLIDAGLIAVGKNGRGLEYALVRTRGDMLRGVHVETRVTDAVDIDDGGERNDDGD